MTRSVNMGGNLGIHRTLQTRMMTSFNILFFCSLLCIHVSSSPLDSDTSSDIQNNTDIPTSSSHSTNMTVTLNSLYLEPGNSLKNCSNFLVGTLLKYPNFMSSCNIPQPSLENTFTVDSLTADSSLCYTVLHNILVLCHSSTPRIEVMESNYSYCPNVKDPVHLAENCKSWITGGDQEQDKRDCEIVAKVVFAAQFVGEEVRCEEGDKVKGLIKLVLDTARALVRVKRDVDEVDKKIEKNVEDANKSPDTDILVDAEVVKDVENPIKPIETIEKTAETAVDPLADSAAKNEQIENIPENEVGGEQIVVNPEENNPPDPAPAIEIQPNVESIESPEGNIDEISDPNLQGQNGEHIEGNEGENGEGQNLKPIVGDSSPVENAVDTPMEENPAKQVDTYEKKVMPGPDAAPASSNFFAYFILLCVVTIVGYLAFHNKKKIFGLILEGRRQQGGRRRSGGREYRKLDSNLEDTMERGRETSMRQVIY